jgi:hypothetical protein
LSSQVQVHFMPLAVFSIFMEQRGSIIICWGIIMGICMPPMPAFIMPIMPGMEGIEGAMPVMPRSLVIVVIVISWDGLGDSGAARPRRASNDVNTLERWLGGRNAIRRRANRNRRVSG